MSAQPELVFDEPRRPDTFQRLGYIEVRPNPPRQIGMPVGYDDRGMPIHKPLWADYEWHATWVSAADIDAARFRRYQLGRHSWLCGDWTSREWDHMDAIERSDRRDQRQMAYDLVRSDR